MPVFLTKKEYFQAIQQGQKTIDIRKGRPMQGGTAVFLSGPLKMRMKIEKVETGKLAEVMREDNFRLILPLAASLMDAFFILRKIYGGDVEGDFTAYHVVFFGGGSGKSELVGQI
jgi:ASC-1-like (ASCH) protein